MQRALTLSPERTSGDDITYPIRQLVEVAVRALSPGINDPHTAMSVLDRFGAALCEMAPLQLPRERHGRQGRCVLTVPAIDYEQLIGAMFQLIRQNASGNASTLVHMLRVLLSVASCERSADRLQALKLHAAVIVGDAKRSVSTPADLVEIDALAIDLERMCTHGPTSLLRSTQSTC
ncbi:DUF2254 domain-containing protein [Janthinobacterium sp. ROICE36]|uniref:DUF2254 domain-containing protein n=1 Tax=Janthinobacterium sp. ROICE36 TaxID=2048670 RepID=UPI0021553936|nr:DUF2254 domain-containing protein [Janthinobacterium sp. ROICE36]